MSGALTPQVIGLFPTPFMRIEGMLSAECVAALIAQVTSRMQAANARSAALTHTALLAPTDDPAIASVCADLVPKLADFGELLFGERLAWSVKEIWGNLLEPGGHQALHNHANSFISGVLYLTESHPSANTVFMKGPGGRDFSFTHANASTHQGPFNADKWIAPDPAPGDLILFPSYLLHEVPVNRGQRRISLAFNAIPQSLDAWGYGIKFSA